VSVHAELTPLEARSIDVRHSSGGAGSFRPLSPLHGLAARDRAGAIDRPSAAYPLPREPARDAWSSDSVDAHVSILLRLPTKPAPDGQGTYRTEVPLRCFLSSAPLKKCPRAGLRRRPAGERPAGRGWPPRRPLGPTPAADPANRRGKECPRPPG